MLSWVASVAIAKPRRIVAIAILTLVVAAIFGLPVAKSLSAGGFQDQNSESARASAMLVDKFHQGGMPLVVVVGSDDGFDSPKAREAAVDIVDQLKQSPHVISASSAWTVPPAAAKDLIARDGKSGLIVANIKGDEGEAPKHAAELAKSFPDDRDGVTVRAGGLTLIYAQSIEQTERDLLSMEMVAAPLSFLVLVWVFGGLIAAAIPIAVAAVAITVSMSALRLMTLGTEISVFALNLTVATGMALGIDYTLLLISRYREEIDSGQDRLIALTRTMVTAGRTVLFSATVVALSGTAMVLFPSYFLKSFGYVALISVAVTAVTAIVLTPAILVLLGPRLQSFDIRHLVRRLFNRPARVGAPLDQVFWYRWSKAVIRHSVLLGLAVVVLLIALVSPFAGVKWGLGDDRNLPTSVSSRQVGDQLRSNYDHNAANDFQIVLPNIDSDVPELARYAAALSRLPDVRSVSSPAGTFSNGVNIGPPSAPTAVSDGSAFLTVNSNAAPFTPRSESQLDLVRSTPTPGGTIIEVTGMTQINRDSIAAVTGRLPLVIAVIGAVTLILMFLLTGSVVLPVKTLVLNILSLTAAFGAVVWIFQDGHLGALGTTPTGTLDIGLPVMLFCMAFGLSMDYEVFLMARIREFWLMSKVSDPPGNNDESVALGVAHTGRVVTAAALVMSISFGSMMVSNVALMRTIGLAMAVAVVVDATLVRMVLVPAFMHVLGRWNWWAPTPLVRLHDRIGISESGPNPSR